jgi:hypothetical protein
VSVVLDPETARKLDALRGDASRSAYLRRILALGYSCRLDDEEEL